VGIPGTVYIYELQIELLFNRYTVPEILKKIGFRIDYFDICDQHRLEAEYTADALVLPAAGHLGKTCLIDNLEI
jgi:pantothenate synthetase